MHDKTLTDKLTIGVDLGAPDSDTTALFLRLGNSGMHIPDPWASSLAVMINDHERLRNSMEKILNLTQYLVDIDEDICSPQTHKKRWDIINECRCALARQDYPYKDSDNE